MQRRILLNHELKHWRQSLSSGAHSSPWYAATTSSSVENRFPRSRAFTVGNRKKSPGCQVWTVRRMGQQLHRGPPHKIHCQIGGIFIYLGWHGQRHCHGAIGCRSVQLLGAFLAIFGEPVEGQLWYTTVQSLTFDAQVVLLPHDHLQQRK